MKVAINHPHRTREDVSDVTIVETTQVPTYGEYVHLPGWHQRLRVEAVSYFYELTDDDKPDECDTGEDPLILLTVRKW